MFYDFKGTRNTDNFYYNLIFECNSEYYNYFISTQLEWHREVKKINR